MEKQQTRNPDQPVLKGSRFSTREALVEAAITCLAKYGFAGTTMRIVAVEAGVTQGPRQYYFPSPSDLYVAVVDHIHSGQISFLSNVSDKVASGSINAKLRAVMEPAFAGCGERRHIAMIELKSACRGNADLRNALGERIAKFEEEADRDWVRLFSTAPISAEELIVLRGILSSTLRGLGMAIAAGSSVPDKMMICNEFVGMFALRIEGDLA